MAGNGRGQMRSYNSNRSQSFIFIGLLVVIAILCFNYWNLSSKNGLLSTEIRDISDKMRQANMRKISIEKRNDVLMQQVRENSEANNKISGEVKMKEDELNQLKTQIQEKDSMLSANNANIEEIKQRMDTCQEDEKSLIGEKELCDRKITENSSACQYQLQELEKNRTALLGFITSERIRILSALAQTYGKKLLEIARKANIEVIDIPTAELPEESKLIQNVAALPAQNVTSNDTESDGEDDLQPVVSNSLNSQLGAGANFNTANLNGNLNSQSANAGLEPNNAVPQIPNVVPADANLPLNGMQAQDPNAQPLPAVPDPNNNGQLNNQFNGQSNRGMNDPVTVNGNPNDNPNGNLGNLGAPVDNQNAPTPLNGNLSRNNGHFDANNGNIDPGNGNFGLKYGNVGPMGNIDTSAIVGPNVPANDNIQGERPQEDENREMAVQGAPAIIDQQDPNAGDAIPLGESNGLMAPNGQGIVMQQAPPVGDLAPKGVQEGEGPQGLDGVRAPIANSDMEVEDQPEDDAIRGPDERPGDRAGGPNDGGADDAEQDGDEQEPLQ